MGCWKFHPQSAPAPRRPHSFGQVRRDFPHSSAHPTRQTAAATDCPTAPYPGTLAREFSRPPAHLETSRSPSGIPAAFFLRHTPGCLQVAFRAAVEIPKDIFQEGPSIRRQNGFPKVAPQLLFLPPRKCPPAHDFVNGAWLRMAEVPAHQRKKSGERET